MTTAPVPDSNQPRFSRNVYALTLTSLLMDVSSEMVVYLIPLFLLNVLGASPAIVGLIDGVAETTASVLKVFSGYLSDRLGSRKWLTVGGYALSAFTKPLYLWVAAWPAVFAVRFTDRVGKGIRTAPRDALIADSVPPEIRGRAFGFHRAGDTAGAAIGLFIAFLIVSALEGTGALTLTREAFTTAVLISMIPAFLAVLALAFGAREVAIKGKRKPPNLSLRGIAPRFRGFLILILIFTLGNSSDSFLVLRAQNLGLSLSSILLMIFGFNILYAATSGPLGALSDRVGRRRVIIGGWLVYALIYLGFGLAAQAWQVVVLYISYGLYYAATEGIAKAYVGDLVAENERGTAYGIFNAAIGLAALPASVIAGLVWQWFGAPAPFFVGCGLALIAVVGFARMERRLPHRHERAGDAKG
jgi:MFS family permease